MLWILRHNNKRNGSYNKCRNKIAPFLYSKKCKKAEFDIIQIYVELKAFFKNMFLNTLLWCPDDIWERNKKGKNVLTERSFLPGKKSLGDWKFHSLQISFFSFLMPEGGEMRMTKRGRCEDDPAKLNNI